MGIFSWNHPLLRPVRNFIRRRVLRKRMGLGWFEHKEGAVGISCDYCADPGKLIHDGEVMCPVHFKEVSCTPS